MKITATQAARLESLGIVPGGRLLSAWIIAYLEGKIDGNGETAEVRTARILDIQSRYLRRFVAKGDGMPGVVLSVAIMPPGNYLPKNRLGVRVRWANGATSSIPLSSVELKE